MLKLIADNKYFYYLCFFWWIIGAFLLYHFTEEELFFYVNARYNHILNALMSAVTEYGANIIPIVLLSLFTLKEMRTPKTLLTVLLFLIVPLNNYLLKMYFSTFRPLAIYGEKRVHHLPWLSNMYYNSFPSGHTIAAFAFMALLTLLLPKPHKMAGILFFVLALGVAYSRLYLGQHFFEDVYAGSIIGTILITFVYYFVNYNITWKK